MMPQQALKQKQAALESQLKRLDSLLEAKQSQLASVQAQIVEHDEELKLAVSKQLEVVRATAERERQSLQSQLHQYSEEHERLVKSNEDLALQASMKMDELRELQRQVEAANQTLEQTKLQQTSVQQLVSQTDQIRQEQASISEEIVRLRATMDGLVKEVELENTNLANAQSNHRNALEQLAQEKESVMQDIAKAKHLLAEYEKSMIDVRTKDEEEANKLKEREQNLEAKQRALSIDRQSLENEKKQFYATKDL